MQIAMPAPGSSPRPAPRLTPRQDEVLALLLAGQTNKQIARTLDISPFTVRAHVTAVMQQFGATRRQDLARLSQAGASSDDVPASAAIAQMPVWRRWALPVVLLALGLAALAQYLWSPYRARPSSAWAAANVVPESVVLRSPAGAPGVVVSVTVQPTPGLADRSAFLAHARRVLDADLWAGGLTKHRFAVAQVKSLECLAYSGVSRPRGSNTATAYTHVRGYFCPHPTRAGMAIRVNAQAANRTQDFAGGEPLRAVLMDLAESAASR
jgi:DNA-binding CsgD family transcriptional regulator